MLAGLLLEPASQEMAVAKLADRLEAKEHKPTSAVCIGNLGEAMMEGLNADCVEACKVALRELGLVLQPQQPVGRSLLYVHRLFACVISRVPAWSADGDADRDQAARDDQILCVVATGSELRQTAD